MPIHGFDCSRSLLAFVAIRERQRAVASFVRMGWPGLVVTVCNASAFTEQMAMAAYHGHQPHHQGGFSFRHASPTVYLYCCNFCDRDGIVGPSGRRLC